MLGILAHGASVLIILDVNDVILQASTAALLLNGCKYHQVLFLN